MGGYLRCSLILSYQELDEKWHPFAPEITTEENERESQMFAVCYCQAQQVLKFVSLWLCHQDTMDLLYLPAIKAIMGRRYTDSFVGHSGWPCWFCNSETCTLPSWASLVAGPGLITQGWVLKTLQNRPHLTLYINSAGRVTPHLGLKRCQWVCLTSVNCIDGYSASSQMVTIIARVVQTVDHQQNLVSACWRCISGPSM